MAFRYQIREAFRSLFNSKRLNLIALAAMSMSLMALGLVLVLNVGIFKLTTYVEEKIEVVVFLNDQAGPKQTEIFLAKLRAHPAVSGVEYVSRDQALKEFSGDQALKRFLDVLGTNPLPASVKVRLAEKRPENVADFVTWLKTIPGVDEATYGGVDADRLLKALQFIRLAVLVLTVSLVLAAVVIISNIISLMVFSRQEEIRIMRMIGATNWFIRGPFLIWGMIQGAAGGLVASGLLYGIWCILEYYVLYELSLDLHTMLPADILPQALIGMAGLVATGFLLGLIGSLVSVGRQLQE
jgi:cell division transport system permease protein